MQWHLSSPSSHLSRRLRALWSRFSSSPSISATITTAGSARHRRLPLPSSPQTALRARLGRLRRQLRNLLSDTARRELDAWADALGAELAARPWANAGMAAATACLAWQPGGASYGE